MKQIMIIALLLGFCSGQKSQPIDFFKESLTFRLDHDTFELDGLYYFRNNTDVPLEQALFYPFPDVEEYGEISLITIARQDDDTNLIYSERTDGVIFKISLQPKEEAAFHIRYIQQLKSNRARYIIVSTQAWGKPFETASYRLEFPDYITITSASIEPDTHVRSKNLHAWTWERENFMPEVDFVFEFE
jgi:hypothetical protein